MIEYIKSQPLIIIAVESKFKKFDYDRFEINYLKQYSNVEIWDLSFLSNNSFNKAISALPYRGDDLKKINSYRKLFSEISNVKKNFNKKNVYFMNFVQPTGLATLLFLIVVKKLGFNSIKYDNSGVPNIWVKNINKTFTYVVKTLMRRIYQLISKLFNIHPTHCIYAGDSIKKKYDSYINKKNTKYLSGNTWDYSKILSNNSTNLGQFTKYKKKAVLLDGAGPMFGSDDLNIGKKTYLTSEIWYPSLVSFFQRIEKETDTTVDIAAHPKTSYESNPSCFGGRNVFYGKTLELVRDSDFVITRQSTAISYAIIFKKPVIFIYSNQLKQDKLLMAGVNKISEILGTMPINIDSNFEDISSYLKINKFCYDAYKKNYLTSHNIQRTNAQILLEDILSIKTLKT